MGASLHLVRPLGFVLTDKALRRAGMDYWYRVQVTVHDDWESCKAALTPSVKHWRYFVTNSRQNYADVTYGPGTALVFGSESTGLPARIVDAVPVAELVRIPMAPAIRSLNLANAVAIAAYEARRQQGFPMMQ